MSSNRKEIVTGNEALCESWLADHANGAHDGRGVWRTEEAVRKVQLGTL